MATTGVSDSWFVDANVLVYAASRSSPWRAIAQQRLQDARDAGTSLVVSPQILREFLVAATRPAPGSPPPPLEPVLEDVRRLVAACKLVDENSATVARLFELLENIPCYGKQIHDANVVATMLTHGIGTLLTHNTGDFERFRGLITVLPLTA